MRNHSPLVSRPTSPLRDSVHCTVCWPDIPRRPSSSDHETLNAKWETSAAFQVLSDAPIHPLSFASPSRLLFPRLASTEHSNDLPSVPKHQPSKILLPCY